MAGYTRQSLATIQPGLDINAEPFNVEYDAIQAAFDNSTGHDHSGLFPGDGAQITLTNAVAGILPVANGGTGVALSTGTTKVVLSNSPTIVTPTIANITGPTTITGALTVTTTGTIPTLVGPLTVSTGGLTVTTGGLVVSAGGATITGTTGITGTTTVTGTFNATTSVSDNGTRVFSPSNLLSFAASGLSNPSGTTSAPGLMAGLGNAISFTSNKTGRVMLQISGMLKNGTNTSQASAQIYYGTGTAPANGAAITGTVAGGLALADIDVGGFSVPFSIFSIITVTTGVAYWFDLAQAAPLAVGTTTLVNIFYAINEV